MWVALSLAYYCVVLRPNLLSIEYSAIEWILLLTCQVTYGLALTPLTPAARTMSKDSTSSQGEMPPPVEETFHLIHTLRQIGIGDTCCKPTPQLTPMHVRPHTSTWSSTYWELHRCSKGNVEVDRLLSPRLAYT